MPAKRIIVILGIAVLCGLLASYAIVRYVREKERQASAGRIELQPVVVAQNDIPIGTRIDASLVARQDWPKTGVPQGAVSEPEALLGRIAKGGIARGEPILEQRLLPKDLAGSPGIMSVIVPPGKRAMAVGVNEVIGVSGFILPKDRVDVIATRSDPKSSETILQNIEVLAVGKRLEQEGKQNIEVPTVTLAVTPEEAERLAFALNEGKIHIALRSILEAQSGDSVRPPRVSARRGGPISSSLPTGAQRVTGRTQGRGGFVVDVIRGDKRALETFAPE